MRYRIDDTGVESRRELERAVLIITSLALKREIGLFFYLFWLNRIKLGELDPGEIKINHEIMKCEKCEKGVYLFRNFRVS